MSIFIGQGAIASQNVVLGSKENVQIGRMIAHYLGHMVQSAVQVGLVCEQLTPILVLSDIIQHIQTLVNITLLQERVELVLLDRNFDEFSGHTDESQRKAIQGEKQISAG
uniref:Uncharacterized protein n=1 Tax=Cacopsylla melanoneura TaxID=428564 RepID=A0A8D8TA49_9HEMI